MMLISHLPVMLGNVLRLRLNLPSTTGGEVELWFRARSHWCRLDATPRSL